MDASDFEEPVPTTLKGVTVTEDEFITYFALVYLEGEHTAFAASTLRVAKAAHLSTKDVEPALQGLRDKGLVTWVETWTGERVFTLPRTKPDAQNRKEETK